MEVRGENQIGALGQEIGEAVGERARLGAHRPAAEAGGVAGLRSAGAREPAESPEAAEEIAFLTGTQSAHAAAESHLAARCLALGSRSRRVEAEQSVVHD